MPLIIPAVDAGVLPRLLLALSAVCDNVKYPVHVTGIWC